MIKNKINIAARNAVIIAAILPGLAFSSFGMSLVSVASAAEPGMICSTMTLVSDSGTQTAGYTETNPVAAPASLQANLYSNGSLTNAIATEAVIPPWVDPATDVNFTGSGATWISTHATWPGGVANSEGSAANNQWRLFSEGFTLPVDATVTSANLSYTTDNAAAVYLNGNATAISTTNGMTEDVYGATPVGNVANYGQVFTTAFSPVAGNNTLDFVSRNWSTESSTNPTGLVYKAVIDYCVPAVPVTDVTVTIVKYIENQMATSLSANNADFPMSATWNAENIGAGTGAYNLSASGFGGDPTPYQAMTTTMTPGADYSTNEVTGGAVVGASCETQQPFSLVGYTTGGTLAEAAGNTPSLTIPAFTNLQSDQYVIVWNHDCSQPIPTPESVKVMISKFVQGALATAQTANSSAFPMSATWNAENVGVGTGTYTLDSTSETPYQTMTVAMTPGADYSTNETLDGNVVAASCETGKPFSLVGYTTGTSYAQAAAATPSMTVPAFTNLQSDQYVIVWNHNCSILDGGISGNVEGSNGVLAVTSIDSVDTTATANGSFADGWKYIFHITAPSTEQNLFMKFSDWLKTGGGGTIPVANNMRISSAQADNAGATILLTAANTYSTPALHMTGDLNAVMVGRQVEVSVEVAVPVGTVDGAYTTNYGVQTTP